MDLMTIIILLLWFTDTLIVLGIFVFALKYRCKVTIDPTKNLFVILTLIFFLEGHISLEIFVLFILCSIDFPISIDFPELAHKIKNWNYQRKRRKNLKVLTK